MLTSQRTPIDTPTSIPRLNAATTDDTPLYNAAGVYRFLMLKARTRGDVRVTFRTASNRRIEVMDVDIVSDRANWTITYRLPGEDEVHTFTHEAPRRSTCHLGRIMAERLQPLTNEAS